MGVIAEGCYGDEIAADKWEEGAETQVCDSRRSGDGEDLFAGELHDAQIPREVCAHHIR